MVNEEYDVELDDTEYEDELEEVSEVEDVEQQQNTRDITGQDMHDLFCESMNCDEAPWLRVVSLNDKEYFNKK